MRFYSLIAIYFIIWWLVIFMILPFGIRTQDEQGEVTLGTPPSAPWQPMLIRKAIVTSIISAILLFGLWYSYTILGWTPEKVSNVFWN